MATDTITTTVASAASVSGSINVRDLLGDDPNVVLGLVYDDLDGTTTFLGVEVSLDGTTWVPLLKDGSRFGEVVDPSESCAVVFDVAELLPWDQIRFECLESQAGSADAQAAARTFTLAPRRF